MLTLETYTDLADSARQYQRAGDNDAAIDQYSELVGALLESDTVAVQSQPELRALLTDAADELIELLRWERRYGRAISLQEELIELHPERTLGYRVKAANLRIEGGQEGAGLHELCEIAEADPENIWGWITLGTAYMWGAHFDQAEDHLRYAVKLEAVERADRAVACRYLYKMYEVQKRVPETIDTWEEMVQLDRQLRNTLPDLIGTLIHWRYYSVAQDYLKLEDCRLRRLYYSGLIDFGNNLMEQAASAWNQVLEHAPAELSEGHDEFAEAGIRVLRPSLALDALGPMIERGEVTYRRLLVAGLAWAQRRIINRARRALDIALRLADLERPRRTRPAGKRRIFDARARILYGMVRVDPDVREELDPYFIPGR